MKKNQKGFSAVEVIAVLVIVGLLGFVGWFIWQKQNKSNTTDTGEKITQNNGNDKQSDDQEEAYVIPDGYTLYEDAKLGFKFAYPEQVGELMDADTGGNTNILLYRKSADKADTFAAHTQSPLYVRVDKKEGFVTRAAKYGPMLEYMNGTWLVSPKDGGDVNNGGYAMGVEYKAVIAKTTAETPIYDFSYTDEGCYRTVWVFELKEAFASITLPAVCADEIDTIPQERLDAYKQEVEKVLKTVQIL